MKISRISQGYADYMCVHYNIFFFSYYLRSSTEAIFFNLGIGQKAIEIIQTTLHSNKACEYYFCRFMKEMAKDCK